MEVFNPRFLAQEEVLTARLTVTSSEATLSHVQPFSAEFHVTRRFVFSRVYLAHRQTPG